MEMTIKDYINNPMGRKNAVISNREMYRSYYTDKFNKLMVRENGKIDYTLYKSKNNYYIHLKIPSETVKNFYYDVVFCFYPKSTNDKTIDNYYVKFYSNDPSFVYTFAHAFAKNKLFIDDLAPKMSKQALKKTATEKNPNSEIGYVKTIYFAYIYMNNKGLFNTIHYVSAEKYDKNKLLKNIMDADEKIKLRQEEGENQRKSKPATKKKEAIRTVTGNLLNRNNDLSVGTVKRVGKVGNIKNTKIIKGTKKSHRI